MKIFESQTQTGYCLSLEGEVSINEAALLKEFLMKHITTQAPLVVDLKGVAKIDTSGLQLLYAAHQTAVQQGQQFSMENPSAAFRDAAKVAGLFFQSPGGYLEGCLWQGGVKE